MANEFKVKKGLIVDGSGGTILDVQGSAGQLFSVTDSLTGDLFAVSDISGVPIFKVNSSGDITLDGLGAGYLKTNVNGVISNTTTIPWSTVSSTPTTISGYGITDAATSAQGTKADAALPKAGGTMTGALAGTTATFSGQAHFKDTGNSSGGSILMGPTGSGGNKWSYLAGTHYNQDTGSGNGSGSAGVAIIGCLSTSTYNKVLIGGNPYEINPATQIEFWTHTATTHTTGGSVKMKIAGDGTLTLSAYGAGILKTNASGVISLDTNTYSTASGVADNADVTPSWVPANDPSYLTSLPSHNHDDRYYTETEIDGTLNTLTASLRANTNITGGGTVTIDGSSYIKNSARFIVIANGRGSHFATNGYFDINIPTSGTITGVGGSADRTATTAGIQLNAWEALYYILPINATNTSVPANFRVAQYTASVSIPEYWVLIAVRNGDTGQKVWVINKYGLEIGESINTAVYDSKTAQYAASAGAVAYANVSGTPTIPSGNAIIDWTTDQGTTNIHSGNYTDTDTWVANSATAAGYVASGANQNSKVWKTNASGVPAWRTDSNTNTTYTASTGLTLTGTAFSVTANTYAAAAHDHSRILERGTIAYGASQLQWTDQSGNGGTGLDGAAPGNPFSDWFHHIIMNHGNSSGYYVDIAACFHSDDLYFRRNVGGTLSTWREIYHTGNLTPLTLGTTSTTAMAGNTTIPSGNAVLDWTVDNNNTVIHSGNYTDTDTWVANSATAAGYVASGANQANKVWKTDANGVPAWDDDRDTVYAHPTGAGNKHIPTGGSAGQFLKYSASGTATWATPSYIANTDTDTTYSAGGGLDLTGTTFSIESDLRDGITKVGKDSNNYIAIDADDNNCIDFYISGVWVARMEADGDLHMKGDVIAYSGIFNP